MIYTSEQIFQEITRLKRKVGRVDTLLNPMNLTGDIIISSDNDGTPITLPSGPSDFVLTSNGTETLPSWRPIGGGGSTIDAIPIDGSTNAVQSNGVFDALLLKADLASPAFTGTVSGITKIMVGLANVDNTSDIGKPVSTAQQTALNSKAALLSPTFTGSPIAPTQAQGDNSTKIATTAYVDRNRSMVVSAVSYTTSTTINMDITDGYVITAQAGPLLFNSPSGTLWQGQPLWIRIKDNGTARALTYSSVFRASSDLPLPTTTIISKTLYMGFIYNTTDSKFDLVSVLNNF